MRFTSLARTALSFMALGLAGIALGDCSARSAAPAAPPRAGWSMITGPGVDRFTSAAPQAARTHIYVGDYAANAVFKYALRNGGLSPQPVSSITSVSAVFAIAVASDGTLYVAERFNTDVKVFAPHAHGNAVPLRTLLLPAVPNAVTVDSNGYLYVALQNAAFGVGVYAPGASGNAQPVATIPQTAAYLAVDEEGDLYLSGPDVSVYATPATNPTLIRQVCVSFAHGIALSNSDHMFVVENSFNRRRLVAAFRQTANGCPAPPHGNIYPTGGFGDPIADATAGNRLFVIDQTYAPPGGTPAPSILEFDSKLRGPQAPLSTVSGAPLQNPLGVAVGP
jgi:hypothetical protein